MDRMVFSRSICFFVYFATLLFVTRCQENQDKHSCRFRETSKNPHKEELFRRLSPLYGKRFTVQADFKYSVGVCINTSVNVNSSVTQENGNKSLTLGRLNDTDILGEDNWLSLSYGSGDMYNATEKCNGTRKTNILILCSPDAPEPVMKFVEHDQVRKDGGCFFMFEIRTCAICLTHPEEGLSRGSVFSIIFLTSIGVYLVVGICYRRLVKGAKGFEQIPHHRFWTKLGNLQADGCNFACRRHEEESWRRLTSDSRPKDITDDQDDALLRP